MNIITEIFVGVAIIFIAYLGTIIKKFFISSVKGKCNFKNPNSNQPREVHEVIIIKHFCKVTSIDCGWYARLTKPGGDFGLKYPSCPMTDFPKGSTEAGKCPFSKQTRHK
ncbi:MAG: hypothetical protein ABR980_11650 [Ignavibacteriaceae bacterium]|jgi:hypothetical protein